MQKVQTLPSRMSVSMQAPSHLYKQRLRQVCLRERGNRRRMQPGAQAGARQHLQYHDAHAALAHSLRHRQARPPHAGLRRLQRYCCRPLPSPFFHMTVALNPVPYDSISSSHVWHERSTLMPGSVASSRDS